MEQKSSTLVAPPKPRLPQAPAATPALREAQANDAAYLRERRTLERNSVLRGLFVLALAVLGISLLRAGVHRAFFTGWWRQW